MSGRALASRVKTFADGSNVWVRQKTEETDNAEAKEARVSPTGREPNVARRL